MAYQDLILLQPAGFYNKQAKLELGLIAIGCKSQFSILHIVSIALL